MKTSQAFAASRQSEIREANDRLHNELLPEFRATDEDIVREYSERIAWAESLEDPLRREAAIECANARLKARRAQMVVDRNNFIKVLRDDLANSLMHLVQKWNGELIKETETRADGKPIIRTKVKFPDNSKAVMAKSLFVDYKLFEFLPL